MQLSLCFCTKEPVRYVLGEKHTWKGTGRKRKCIKAQDTMMYVPLLDTIQILLKNKAIVTQVYYRYDLVTIIVQHASIFFPSDKKRS